MKEIEGALAATSGRKNRLVISLDFFKEVKLFSIRQWFINKQGEWCPTHKGVSLTREKFDFLLRAIQDHDEEINKWLQDEDTTHQEVLKAHKIALQDGERAVFKKRPYNCEKESWRSPEIFRVEAEGGQDKLILNTDHSLVKMLLETANISNSLSAASENIALLQMIEILLLSFARTQRLFEENQQLDQETFFEIIMTNWGLLAQRYLDQSRGESE